MAFRPTLVALPRITADESADYGNAIEEIVLQNDSESAVWPILSNPGHAGYKSKVKAGDDFSFQDRAKAELNLKVDYITSEQKAQIERLKFDNRSVLLCPNFDANTPFSWPLFRSGVNYARYGESMGDLEGSNRSAGGAIYIWDTIRKVYTRSPEGQEAFGHGGPWNRFHRSIETWTNRITKPHPDSTSTGWSINTGSPTISYRNDYVRTPVLSYRDSSTANGITNILCPQTGSTAKQSVSQAATGITSGKDVVASLPIRGNGEITITLTVGILNDLETIDLDGDWQLIKLRCSNAGSTTATLTVTANDTATTGANVTQNIQIGPVFAGDFSGTPVTNGLSPCPDWVDPDGVLKAHMENSSIELCTGDITLSGMFRWAKGDCWYMQFGSNYLVLIKYASTDTIQFRVNSSTGTVNFATAEFNLDYGDWFMLTATLTNGIPRLYCNGVPHSDNATVSTRLQFAGTYGDADDFMRYGDDSGACLLRVDNRAWSDQEVRDHYDTYGSPAGRGAIARSFGRSFAIESITLEPQSSGESGVSIWTGSIGLRELKLFEDIAPFQLQELR